MSDFEIKGMRQLQKKIDKLSKKVAGPIVRKGVKEGLRVAQKATKANILTMLSGGRTETTKKGKVKTSSTLRNVKGRLAETMHNSVIVRSQKKQRKGVYGANVNFDKKAMDRLVYPESENARRQFIPSAIEYGHVLVFMGHHTGKRVRPMPFMRNAFDSTKDKVVKVATTRMWSEIKKATR